MKTFFKKQQAFTLVELMISMTLSLIVIFAVSTILISSNQAASVSDTLTDSQESGRFAVDYMNRQLLRAGFDPENTGIEAFATLCVGAADTMCHRESETTTGDQIAIRRIAQAGSGNAVTCYGTALQDVNGLDISSDVTVIDVYWVELGNGGLSSLRCQSFDEDGLAQANPGDNFGDAQSLAAGIVAMHVLYGESNEAPDNNVLNVTGYYNANQVTDWNNVHAVRIAFLTRALSNTEGNPWNQNYLVLDSDMYTFDDAIARQVFSTTIALLN